MRNQCGIKNCNNNRSKGFHLFRFPLHRKDHLKRWLEAIGEVDFQPTKSDVICSAHFTTNDYMIRPFAHDVRLKRLAVPSVFQDPLETTPMIANIINSNASASEVIMSLPTLVVHSQTKKSENSEKAKTYCFQPLEKIANTSTVDSTIKITLINKQKITNKSKYYFKNQKMNLKKKQMQTFITTLKQDLIKNKKTIQLQQNLLTALENLDEDGIDNVSEEDERMELSPVQAVQLRVKNYVDMVKEFSDVEFKREFRISRVVFTYLLNLIKPNLEKPTGSGRCPINPYLQLLVTLWTMATPDSYRSVCHRFNIGRATAWRAHRKVCAAIYSLADKFIKWPNIEEAQQTWTDVQYKHKFPKVLGAIDSTHIRIQKPKEHAENYVNQNGHYSIHLQAVCDSTLKFIHCYAEQPGSMNDMCVFWLSDIPSMYTEKFFPQNSHLIGDTGYAVQKHVMVPYDNNDNDLSEAQINFNERLCSAHIMIKEAVSYLKGRFRSLEDKLYMKRTDLIPEYIIACCVLHNICILHGDFLDDIVITEKDNNLMTKDDIETFTPGKEEGIEKRNALTNILNESVKFNVFDNIAIEHSYSRRSVPFSL
ncbi:PREDICTED: putative nuclease HARBI1 isoform X1 [Acromyrmex echinatior]|uniref:putative nuclease HARBI1 isoform X1 n=1 Tax=Acromyrmex echinatior TaxID=103372 RepID=UPI000580E0E2|nr:PREDICTED: putative nuclease HARBI1 isoform X1 [Acromyrmex echinatior]XP_011059331.1 PREDICTED: putative nuclease HARBI1 isoform X1 [Acromyrmex echinatior]